MKNEKKENRNDFIHWAGGVHARGHFNRTKDDLADWTKVYFRHY